MYIINYLADKLQNMLHMPSGTAAAWKMAAVRDRNM